MVETINGALMMAIFVFVVQFARKRGLVVQWWQWLLTIVACLGVLVSNLIIYDFVLEGSPKAALVNGGIGWIFSILLIVLLARTVFLRKES